MIKLKTLLFEGYYPVVVGVVTMDGDIKSKETDKTHTDITEVIDDYKSDWIDRYKAIVENGRIIAYHGTTTKNYKLIKKTGFRKRSYFSIRPEYSKRIVSIYHNIPESKVILMKVKLPLDAIDFVGGDIVSNREIGLDETL